MKFLLLQEDFSRIRSQNSLQNIVAQVTHLFEGGNKLEPNNYRPISVIPVVDKIVEKCMFTRFRKKIDRNAILSPRQFGFTRRKTCTDAINSLTEYIYEALNYHKFVIKLFVDLKKSI